MQIPLLSRAETIEKLSAKGITPTQQRVEIAQIMLSKPQHLSAEQVLEMVNADRALVSKATVYNTLGLFAEKGLVREVIIDPTKIFYDTNTTHHYHFYNVEDGSLVDILAEQVQIDRLPTPPDGMVTDGVEVIIRVKGQTAQTV